MFHFLHLASHDPRLMAGKEEGLVFIEEKRTDSPQLDALPPTGSWERLLAEKKLVRKLDTRVLPAIILIYIMNFIDVGFTQL